MCLGGAIVQYGTPSALNAGRKFQLKLSSGVVPAPEISSTGRWSAVVRFDEQARAAAIFAVGTLNSGPGPSTGAYTVSWLDPADPFDPSGAAAPVAGTAETTRAASTPPTTEPNLRKRCRFATFVPLPAQHAPDRAARPPPGGGHP